MTYPQTGWWAKLFVDFSVDVPTPEINVGGQERYPASFAVAVDNPSLSFDGGVRESAEFSVSGLNPLINLDVTRIERSFSVNCPDPRMDFMSGERYYEELEIPCPTPDFSFVGRERYPREFSVPVAEPKVNMVGSFIQRASFGITCPTPTFPFRVREYHAPEEFIFTASNLNWQLPDWCDAYDMIGLGGGGNGNGGGSGYSNGIGGAPGGFVSKTIRRGIDIPWENRAHAITVGANSATNMGPIGLAGVGISAPAGANGSGWGGQQGLVPGCHTFNGRQYCGGINNIPASGANYSGWSGCGDGNLGGPGGGGAGGRGALIGGDPGGQGCRGQGWIYCYQLMPPPIRAGVLSANFKGSQAAITTTVTIPPHNIGDIILLYGYAYPATIPADPIAGGTVPTWIELGQGGGGANVGGQRLWYTTASRNDHTSGTFTGVYALIAVVIGDSRGIGARAFDVGGSVAGQLTAPGLTLMENSGKSQILHFFGCNANSWNDVAGYTTRQRTTYVGLYTKNDPTTSAPALTVTNNSNSPTLYRCCSIEVLGQ